MPTDRCRLAICSFIAHRNPQAVQRLSHRPRGSARPHRLPHCRRGLSAALSKPIETLWWITATPIHNRTAAIQRRRHNRSIENGPSHGSRAGMGMWSFRRLRHWRSKQQASWCTRRRLESRRLLRPLVIPALRTARRLRLRSHRLRIHRDQNTKYLLLQLIDVGSCPRPTTITTTTVRL